MYESLLRKWVPMKVLLENGLPDREICIISESISSTLQEHGRVEGGSSVCGELEEFLADVLDEFAVETDQENVRAFSCRVLEEHNAQCFRRK